MPDAAAMQRVYGRMSLIKANDDMMRAAIRAGKLQIIYYSPRGQEVIPSAIADHLDADDRLITIYRGLHDQVAKGVPLKQLWAEYAGKATGTCKGKGGPMHITHPDSGVMVTTGIVGSGMPIALGLALAAQMDGTRQVTVTNFGDGATNIGAFHESLNMASIWKLPILFICQNNQYAEHTSYRLGTAVEAIAERAAGYSMPGITVDGNDPVAMWKAAGEAVARARAGQGPTLLECRTFRFHGHLVGDDSHYIPKEDLAAAIAADPVPLFRRRLIEEWGVAADTLDAIDADNQRQVEEALQFALDSDYPAPEENGRDILAEVAA
ncbi:thiamine pyrophosphate-dependent dehydrogenase E1 component subunit alpha [Sphingomonadaceae bacterium jetA1]|jgi:pyruvate dehydrogenase E1 component alpha subunit|uniref:thiamine pyrophosphate-dependent dehydrogenase E1 component subunit alpha n=1 Tax=Facivitalis istanbulensis TaxID=3075838 RepID=UPI00346AF356